MKNYRSMRYATRNENDRGELTLEVELTLWEMVVYAFKHRTFSVPATREDVYEVKGTYWVDKKTGKIPDTETQFECFEAKACLRADIRPYTKEWKDFE